jgi:hypothetical protein
MSTLSQFAPFAGGGIKSIQTGYLNNVTGSNGTNATEDERFRDVTISSVNTNKAVPDFFGSAGLENLSGGYYFFNTTWRTSSIRPRFTSSTNLRLSTFGTDQGGTPYYLGRWYVIESN